MTIINPNDYTYNYTITIDHTKIDATLPNFPLKVYREYINALGTAQKCLSSGKDIVFTDSSNNLLDFEFVYYDFEEGVNTTEIFECYVKIPSISPSVNSTINMFYGKSGVTTSLQNMNAVWDSNYEFVVHMGRSGELIDSTINSRSLGSTTNAERATTTSGLGYYFGGTEYFGNGFYPSDMTDFEYFLVANVDDKNTDNYCGCNDYNSHRFYIGTYTGGNIYAGAGSAYSTTVPNGFSDGVMFGLNFYALSSTAYVEANNIPKLNYPFTFSGASSNETLVSGVLVDSGYYRRIFGKWVGDMVEVRVSKTSRSSAWRKADDYSERLLTLATDSAYVPIKTNNSNFLMFF